MQRAAVNGALNLLIFYPHGESLRAWITVPAPEIAAVYERWLGEGPTDGSPRGFFDRLS